MRFHRLGVETVEPLTDEAVAVTLAVPDELRTTFTYEAGQHVTVRADIGGQDVRRSYSICANATTGELRIGIKRLDGGIFSTWATKELRAGMALDVMEPVGEFTLEASHHIAAIAAGSGITPILSLVSTHLSTTEHGKATLILGNRTAASIMFLEELEALKDRYTDRFHLMHVLSGEHVAVDLFSGRIDGAKLDRLFETLVDQESVDHWYLCGPFGLVASARSTLEDRGIDPAVIHDELFFAGPPTDVGLPAADDDTAGMATVTFTLEGRGSVVQVDPAGPSILDHALQVRRELPFSCKGGACATCKAQLIDGEITMDKNWALVPEEVDAGLILTCQAHPRSDRVTLDFDV